MLSFLFKGEGVARIGDDFCTLDYFFKKGFGFDFRHKLKQQQHRIGTQQQMSRPIEPAPTVISMPPTRILEPPVTKARASEITVMTLNVGPVHTTSKAAMTKVIKYM